MVTSAQAVSLVVMNVATNATNSAIPVGQQVVTFGVQVNSSDLVGAGTNPVLVLQNLTFGGNGIVPINQAGGLNKIDVQAVQSNPIDIVAGANGAPVTQAQLNANQQKSVYADSWWYNSGTGTLQGVIDDIGDVGNLTDPTWQTGPVKNVGTSGFTWTGGGLPGIQAGATVAAALLSSNANATTGQFMMFSGIYGPNGSNALTGSTLAPLFVNNQLTVPVAQIVTTGNVDLPGTNSNAGGGSPGGVGTGTYIGLIGVGVSNGPTGNGTYNVGGGNPGTNPGWHYDFASKSITAVPEPGTILLAGMGALGMLFAWKRRK
jgi:hypothetical protein